MPSSMWPSRAVLLGCDESAPAVIARSCSGLACAAFLGYHLSRHLHAYLCRMGATEGHGDVLQVFDSASLNSQQGPTRAKLVLYPQAPESTCLQLFPAHIRYYLCRHASSCDASLPLCAAPRSRCACKFVACKQVQQVFNSMERKKALYVLR